MNKYTVVLLRPEYMGEDTGEHYGLDIYVALVESDTSMDALKVAQAEVFEADKKDQLRPKSPTDYKLCVMFPGHLNPTAYGWQV